MPIFISHMSKFILKYRRLTRIRPFKNVRWVKSSYDVEKDRKLLRTCYIATIVMTQTTKSVILQLSVLCYTVN